MERVIANVSANACRSSGLATPAAPAASGSGLTVSRGLTEAMRGTLEPEETSGGGLNMAISVPAVPRPVQSSLALLPLRALGDRIDPAPGCGHDGARAWHGAEVTVSGQPLPGPLAHLAPVLQEVSAGQMNGDAAPGSRSIASR
jgi:hypothetical protein